MAADRAPRREKSRAPAGPGKRLRALTRYLADPEAGEADRLIYEPVRLGIMSALAVSTTQTFSDLKELLKTSDGNLSVHARKLEDAGYLTCRKAFEERMPRTEYRITPKGRKALERYLAHMEALFRATRGS
jgi:DNA-binding HxlR family transcriptional regulator